MMIDDEYEYDDNHHESTFAVIDVEAEVCTHTWFRVHHLQKDRCHHCNYCHHIVIVVIVVIVL